MKKMIPSVCIAFCFQACMFTHSQGYHAYFCTSTSFDEERFLFIDKEKIGPLPYTRTVPDCSQMPSASTAVYSNLTAGEHLVEIRTADGSLLFSEELDVERKNGSSTISSHVEKPGWDTRVKVKDDCLVIELIH